MTTLPELKPLAFYKQLCFSESNRLRLGDVTTKSWPVLTLEVAAILANYIGSSKTLDAGAGTGFISAHLKRLGVNITASDIGGAAFADYGMNQVYVRDHEGDSLLLLPGDFQTVLLSWPPYDDSFGYSVISKMKPGTVLIYNGEGYGGCTGDDAFHYCLEVEFVLIEDITESLNQNHHRFHGIHDRWSVYKKK